jgi:hypothetical protein
MSKITHPVNATARAAADHIAQHLAVPAPTPPQRRWRAQSLADGAAGVALLHIERAHARLGGWDTAHAWLAEAAQSDIFATTDAGLYLGAPAVAFALHTATTDGLDKYRRALSRLNRSVTALTHRRIDQAYARIELGQVPKLAEFDVISGLAGIGAHLLRYAPGDDALERVLIYLVRLSEPLRGHGATLPGWWTDHDPHASTSPDYPGGHGNLSLAHGIARWRCSHLPDARASSWTGIWRPLAGSAPGWIPGAKTAKPDPGGHSGSPATSDTAGAS